MNIRTSSRTGKRTRALFLAFLPVFAAAADAAEKTYQYYRFQPTKLRDTPNIANSIQLSEFEFMLGNTILDLTGVTVTNPGGNSPGPEQPTNLIDQSTGSKWLDFNKQSVVFDFGEPTTIDAYNFATAGDAPERDPVSWIFYGSENGIDWVPLDIQKDFPTTTQRQIHEEGFTIPDSIEPVILSFSTSESVVINGSAGVTLDWDVSLADTITIDQGIGSVPATGSQELILPDNSDTTFTITATNAAGEASAQVTVRTVTGGTVNYRYIRFRPTKLRDTNSANSIQLAEFYFLDGSNPVIPVAATNLPGGNSPAAEGPGNLIDGSNTTKWLNFSKTGVLFDLGEDPPAITGYGFATANDAIPRDPVRWLLEGSNDEEEWVLIDNMTAFDFATPVARQTFSQDIPLPGSSLSPYAELRGDTKAVAGGGLALSWETGGATEVTISGVGTVPASGSVVVEPTENTVYTLTATAGDKSAVSELSVEIVEPGVAEINYPNFDEAGDEIALIGRAEIVNVFETIPSPGDANRLRITPNQGSLTGVAWHRSRVDVSEGFDANFGLHFLSSGSGADGMAFVIQNHPQGTLAVPAGGYENGLTQNALNISFDSYRNDGEPSAAVIRVFDGVNVIAVANLAEFPGLNLGGTEEAPDLTKTDFTAAPYQVRVTYVPGDLDVYFDGVLVIDSVYVDLGEIGAADANGKSWMGFTSRTGGQFEAHDVTSWVVTPGVPVGPPAPLVLLSSSIDLTANQVTLTWVSSPENTYRITTSTDLINWVPLQSGIVGAGSQTTQSVGFTPAAKQFFRVEEE